jgi:hypothetical protein
MPGPPIGPANWSNPTSGSVGSDQSPPFPPRSLISLLSRDSPGDCVTVPPPCSIPTSSVGLRRRDAAQSIDQATAVLPVREIYPICVPVACISFRLRSLGLRPWRPRACSRVARPCPRWCLGLVSWCCIDVSSATSSGSMPSWPRGHCLAMPRWYLQGAV